MFDIPVALFFMKRTENTLKVLSGIAKVQPRKLYLISDGGRTEEEHEKVKACRAAVEAAIDWECEIVRDYAETNAGILDRIGFGAKRVLEKEESAIFLEDDNYPEETFFYFCKEMLEKYRDNTNILWICGTNYLEEYDSPYSYVFTKHTLPCGWASWGHKYPKVYDGYLEGLDDPFIRENIRGHYGNKRLEKQKLFFIDITKKSFLRGNFKTSWDHQMTFTLMSHNMYGIAPKVNLIKNIGVDAETSEAFDMAVSQLVSEKEPGFRNKYFSITLTPEASHTLACLEKLGGPTPGNGLMTHAQIRALEEQTISPAK